MRRTAQLLRSLLSILLITVGEGIQFLRLAVSSRAELSAEVLFLRKQLAFYREHQVPPRKLTDAARFSLALWSQLFNWRAALMIVQPETLIGWHRQDRLVTARQFAQKGTLHEWEILQSYVDSDNGLMRLSDQDGDRSSRPGPRLREDSERRLFDHCRDSCETWQKGGLARRHTALIHLVRSDPKNLVYFFQEDRERPGHFIFFEVFATKEDFEAHNSKPYVKEWFAKLPELADGGVTTTRMEVQPAADK
jgi:quinol monooxygenase YgiN